MKFDFNADMHRRYKLLAGGSFGAQGKKYVGEKHAKVCRFCQRMPPEVTFRKEAHAIPYFLGNNELISYIECDSCNTKFGAGIEDHLDKFTAPYRRIAQIAGRNGIPAYKSNDKSSRMDFNGIPEVCAPKESEFAKFDDEKNEATLKFRRNSYIPLMTYKALCKIAISIIENDNDVKPFRHTIAWILGDESYDSACSKLLLSEIFISGYRPQEKVSVNVYVKDKYNSGAFSFATVGFGNLLYQFRIPTPMDKMDPVFMYTSPILFLRQNPFLRYAASLVVRDMSADHKISDDVPVLFPDINKTEIQFDKTKDIEAALEEIRARASLMLREMKDAQGSGS